MTEGELLEHVFDRLLQSSTGAEIFSAIEARQWPENALTNLIMAEVFRPAQPARVIECDGCEKNCFKPVHVRVAESARPARAFVVCDEAEDLGRIAVELRWLEQWQISGETLAGAVGQLLGFSKSPQVDPTGKRWILGILGDQANKGSVTLSTENGAFLILAQQSIPLTKVLTLDRTGLNADKATLMSVARNAARQPASGIGSPGWFQLQAKAAADARHSKPGGSRDVRDQIRAIWASGKYTSRDRCAEEECGTLGISYSTARKALRRTPEPGGT